MIKQNKECKDENVIRLKNSGKQKRKMQMDARTYETIMQGSKVRMQGHSYKIFYTLGLLGNPDRGHGSALFVKKTAAYQEIWQNLFQHRADKCLQKLQNLMKNGHHKMISNNIEN